MKKNQVVLQFINYSPRIYSGFDKFNLLLAKRLVKENYTPVFVFADTLKHVPAIATDFETVGAKIEIIQIHGKWSVIKQVYKLYKKYRPIVVHTHFVEFLKLLTAVFSFCFGAKHFTSFHSTISILSTKEYIKQKGCFKRIGLWIYYRLLLIFSHKIFAVSEAILKQYKTFSNSNSTKITKMYLGISLPKEKKKQHDVREILHLPKDKVLFCHIAAIEEIKGIDVWCRAIYELIHIHNQTNFLFCHIGGLRNNTSPNLHYQNEVCTLAHELQIENYIVWHGHRNDITDILDAYDIYVHPSRMEGLGIANLEAAVHGLPIIATKVGGIPEVVVHGVNGFLVRSEDPQELAKMMLKLMLDTTLRKKMGGESLNIVKEQFEINTQTRKCMDEYIN